MSAPTGDDLTRPKARTSLPWRVRGLAVVLVGLVAVLWNLRLPFLARLEFAAYDMALASRDPQPPSEHVVLALVDEEAINAIGRWPWRRDVLADVVTRLSQAGAKVVAFTMGFLEPDSGGVGRFAKEVRQALARRQVADAELEQELVGLERAEDTDQLLADAIRQADADVVLGYFFAMRRGDLPYPLPPAEQDRRTNSILPAAMQPPLRGIEPTLDSAFAPQPPVEALGAAAPSKGFLRFATDADGGVRRAMLAIGHRGRQYPSLATEAAWCFLGKHRTNKFVSASENGTEGLVLAPEHFVWTDEGGEVMLNFVGPTGSFPQVSIADVLSGQFAPDAFRDKLVLIGATAEGIGGLVHTPAGDFTPSVEVHATVVDNLLEGRAMVRYKGLMAAVDLALILLPGIAAALFLGRFNALAELGATLASAGGYVAFATWLLQVHGQSVTVVFPPLALLVVFGFLTLSRYRAAEDQRKQIEGTFGRYVAPAVMEQMMANPDMLRLGGEERVITVLFSDLKGFTAASEALGPSRMVDLMCEYFEEMTARIYEHQGLLKEYVGDEIMAIYGAPLEDEEHALNACRAALAMKDRLTVLQAEWVAQGRPKVWARWGVNSGPMLVGNLGSSYRYAYGALGDNVNLGSRLEGLNGQYGTDIMIGENTEALVRGKLVLRELDAVQVKGKTRGVRVFELLGPAGMELGEAQEGLLKAYATGLEAYRAQAFDDAIAAFRKAQGFVADDGPSAKMIGRCEYYLETPPGEGWNGVFVATEK